MILYLSQDHSLLSDTNILGVSKENRSETLEIHVQDPALLNKWAYIEFRLCDDTSFLTTRLDIVDGVITYTIPNSIMKGGYLKFQVVFRDETSWIWKSFIKMVIVKCSLNVSDDVAEENPDFITEAQKILDKCEAAALDVENKVDKSTKINGYTLEQDVNLQPIDVNTYSREHIDDEFVDEHEYNSRNIKDEDIDNLFN